MKKFDHQIQRANSIILMICMFLLIVFLPLQFVSFNEDYYYSEFEKYNVYDNFNVGKMVVNHEFSKVLDYVQGKSDKIDSEFFNEKEKTHLEDVKKIFSSIKRMITFSILFLVLTILALAYERKHMEIVKSILRGAYLSLGFVGLVGIGSLVNFNRLFILMHEIVFTNNLWMLDFYKSNLIRMLPEGIFADISMLWIFSVLSFALFTIIACIITKKTQFKNSSKDL